MDLTTETDLALQILKLPEDRVAKMRRQHNWPHVRLGRFDIRYTDQQIDQIVGKHSVTPKKGDAGAGPIGKAAGLTQRSAARQARKQAS